MCNEDRYTIQFTHERNLTVENTSSRSSEQPKILETKSTKYSTNKELLQNILIKQKEKDVFYDISRENVKNNEGYFLLQIIINNICIRSNLSMNFSKKCSNILSSIFKTDLEIPVESFYGNISEFLNQNVVQFEIARRFKLFLRTFEVNNQKIYISLINDVARMGGKSLQVDYIQFATVNPTLGMWMADAPKPMLEILNRSAQSVFIELYPDNNNVTSEIYVRFNNVPISDSLKNIRNIHLNNFIRVLGVVIRCTGVFPRLSVKCNSSIIFRAYYTYNI